MAEAGRGSLRLGAVLALAVVALFEVLSLAHGVRSQRRLRARVSEAAERRVEAARSALEPVLARGREAWDEAARLALSLELASEVEVLDPAGEVVFSRPHIAPVSHRLARTAEPILAVGRVHTAVARDGASVRVLTYVPLPAGSAGHVLRLSAPAPDLEDEAREWQTVVLGHAAALAALGLAAALVLWPGSGAATPPTESALIGLRGGDGSAARARPGAEREVPAGDPADGGADQRAGGDGARRRAHGRHRARGAQRPRHDRRLRAARRARRGRPGRGPGPLDPRRVRALSKRW